jgi:hypothetical protein
MAKDLQSDKVLRQYLLGQLSDSERDQIERQYLADSEYLDQLLVVEDDLFDEYLGGDLTKEERALFDQRLLATPKQRQRLQQARYLQQAMEARRLRASRTDENPAGSRFSWLSIFQPGKIPIWAGALALLLLLALGSWFVIRERQKGEQQRAQLPQNETFRPPVNSGSVMPTPSPAVSPRAVLALNDAGGQVSLDETGNVTGLSALSPPVAKAVKDALTTQHVNTAPALQGLRAKNGTLMGTPSEGVPFVLVAPVAEVVRTDRPTFAWQALSGATSYSVTIYDMSFKEVASSGAQTGLTWKIDNALPRGQIYLWQVTATKNGETLKSPVPPAPEARFRVLSQDRAAALTQIERANPNSHLALGVLYAEAGLLKEAQREFRLLVKTNPGSELAQKLLRQVSK